MCQGIKVSMDHEPDPTPKEKTTKGSHEVAPKVPKVNPLLISRPGPKQPQGGAAPVGLKVPGMG